MHKSAIRFALLFAALAVTEASFAQELTGVQKRVKDSGEITLGYRESSVPFSYLDDKQQPVGYSIDLCREVVEDVSTELGGIEIKIAFVPVTSANRFDKVKAGEIDLECGSTTSNLQRQKEVSFSPTFFVAGTKLMVPKASTVQSYRDLAGKTVVVTAGTTNEAALRTLSDKQKLGIKIVSAPDHAQSVAQLASGGAEAFATDDVLLYGLLAQNKAQADYVVTGDFLSYDPYGIMYRKGDTQLAQLVNDTFHTLAEDREIERRYTRWFLRKLPASGVSLDLPMSPQLETIIQTMVARTE